MNNENEYVPDFNQPDLNVDYNDKSKPVEYTIIKINGKDYKVLSSYLEECEKEGKTCALIKDDTVEFITDEEFKKRKKANVKIANSRSKNYMKNQRYRR